MLKLKRDPQISKEVITLAIPVIISNISRVLMGLTDMAMVGHMGANALAAVGMGSMLTWTFMVLGIAIRTATQTVSARRLGQKKLNECGTALRNGHLIGFFIGIPALCTSLYFNHYIVNFFVQDEAIINLCLDYTSICFLSIYFTIACFVFQGFFTGIEKPKVHLNVTIISNILNVYLNAGLIYGSNGVRDFFESLSLPILSKSWILWSWLDFPALGVKGAALATLIASVWALFHYSLFLFKSEIKNNYSVFKISINYKMLKKQIQLAVPHGIQEVLVTGGFAMFYKIMGLIGTLELASTQLVFTIMHSSFMPALGVGQACSTLVGKYLGEKKSKKAEISIIESVIWAGYIMGVMGLIFILFPKWVIPIFTDDINIIALSITPLIIVGFLQFIDAIAITLWFALSGAGNTLFPSAVDGILCWFVFLPLSYFTGVILEWGYLGPWLAFSIYLTLLMVIMLWKTSLGTWKKIEI